jgi:hypothetical protein
MSMDISRRSALMAGGLATLAAVIADETLARPTSGFDNQAVPDQGNGTFINPILSGDRADPAILRDGADYYMTFSSFDAYPGLTIWHSRDLVNWQPRKPALFRNIGSVWAVSLVKHNGRYFLYISKGGKERYFRNLGRSYRWAVERSCPSGSAAPHRSMPCGGRGWLALAVPVGRRSRSIIR